MSAYAVRAGYALASDLAIIATLGAWRIRGSVRDSRRWEARAAPDTSSVRGKLGINYKAVFLAAVAAIVVGAIWYSPALFGGAWASLKTNAGVRGAKISAAEGVGELVRSSIVAYVLARFVVLLRVAGWRGTMLLAGWVWLGFHATLLLFSVVHEHMPLALYAIHAGHGLANELVIAAILGAWQRRTSLGDVQSGRAKKAESTNRSSALQS